MKQQVNDFRPFDLWSLGGMTVLEAIDELLDIAEQTGPDALIDIDIHGSYVFDVKFTRVETDDEYEARTIRECNKRNEAAKVLDQKLASVHGRIIELRRGLAE